MKLRVELVLEVDDMMTLLELAEGLPTYLVQRKDIVSACVADVDIELPGKASGGDR